MKTDRILVPIKPGASGATLDLVCATAASLGAAAVFAAVVEPADVAVTGRTAGFAVDILRERKTLAERALAGAVACASERGVPATSVVAHGAVPEALVHAAEEHGCDLILLRVGRQGELSRLAHRIIDATLARNTTVLVVPGASEPRRSAV